MTVFWSNNVGVSSVLVIVQVTFVPRSSVTTPPTSEPPSQLHVPPVYPVRVDSDRVYPAPANTSWNDGLAVALVKLRPLFGFAAFADSVKSAAPAVPPSL